MGGEVGQHRELPALAPQHRPPHRIRVGGEDVVARRGYDQPRPLGPLGLHLVCTNGRHDPCCADLGRPVVRALVDSGVDDVWESSHVGGDRFAANIVLLPDGVYYGRVGPDDAADLLAAHRAGTLSLDRFRGRSHLPPLVQAADLFARRHLDESRVDGTFVVSTDRRVDGTVAVLVEQRAGTMVEVVVRRRRAVPRSARALWRRPMPRCSTTGPAG